MSEIPAWWFYIVIALQIGVSFTLGVRCDILSRRIDTVHKRITLNNRMNGLKSGAWDDDTSRVPSEQLLGEK